MKYFNGFRLFKYKRGRYIYFKILVHCSKFLSEMDSSNTDVVGEPSSSSKNQSSNEAETTDDREAVDAVSEHFHSAGLQSGAGSEAIDFTDNISSEVQLSQVIEEQSEEGTMYQQPTIDARDVFFMNSTFEEMVSDAINDENEDAYRSEIDEETTSFPNVTADAESNFSSTEPAVVSEENSLNYDHLVGDDGNSPIFPGLSCTKGQLLTLVLAFFLRFPNTKESLQGLLDLLNALVPNCIRGTKYFFDRYFFGGLNSFDYHFVCPICFTYLGRNPKKDEKLSCFLCKKDFELKDLKKQGAFMLTKSIKSQIKAMLENGNLWEAICNRPTFENGHYGEVYSGDLYRNAAIKTFLENGDNFTMTLNTDGVQVFNSINSIKISNLASYLRD